MRLTRSYDPWVQTAWVDGRRIDLSTRMRLSRCLTQYPGRRLDLDVEFERGHRIVGFRVVVLPGRDKARTRLCTNLPRTPFSLDLVARLYRFRWQIAVSSQGHINQSVQVRPRPADSGLVAGRRRGAQARRRSPPTSMRERRMCNTPGCNVQ